MRDIENSADVQLLVDRFYEKVLKDDIIGVFFTETVQLDWQTHIPTMYNFWETILLSSNNYHGNPMAKHKELNKKKKLEPEHFKRWLALWKETVNSLFDGEKATMAINKSEQIGQIMQLKIVR